MRKTIANVILSKPLFTGLISSFIVVIIILSSFNIFSYKFYINNIEEQIIESTNERLYNVVSDLEQYFDIVQKAAIRLYLEDDVQEVLKKRNISDYDIYRIYNVFKQYRNDFPYVPMFYLFNEKSNFVITPTATYSTESFFNTFYNSGIYNYDFWLKESKSPFYYRLYPASNFAYYLNEQEVSLYDLMPMAFKVSPHSSHILVVMIDIKALSIYADSTFMEDFYIVNGDEIIFESINSNGHQLEIPIDKGDNYTRVDDGYLFLRKSTSRGLKYYKLVLNHEIKSQLKKTNFIFLISIIVSVVISFIISLYMVMRFNNPVKRIAEIIGDQTNTQVNYMGISLKDIQDHVQQMALKNIHYAEKIDERDSTLNSFIYQSKIRDIYSEINQLLDETALKDDYAIIYFKVHYRDRYFNEISDQTNIGTFYLKELIGLYIHSYFNSSVTFNIEQDQIISIINREGPDQEFEDIMAEIMEKLRYEEEYLFMTVIVSRVYSDISKLSEAYYNTIAIARYRQLLNETQIIYEDRLDTGSSKFYFSLDQVNRFTKSLYNANEHQALDVIESILEYNFRKKVNQFYMGLLGIEIINHSMKVLMELYYDIPKEFNIDLIYDELSKCSTIEEYRDVSSAFISTVVNYIKTHEEEEDYIIDHVKNYIEDKYMTDIYLDLLADNLDITRSYLSSYFKEKTGIYLNDYLNNYRIQKALPLLKDSSIKIHEISKMVGIANSNTFTRLFKKFTGQTPSEYRQSTL